MASNTFAAVIVGYLVAINTTTYAAFYHDKRQAILGGWRVRESTLLMLSLAGGWPCAKLGQHLFRHKTRKQPFASNLNMVIAVNVIVAVLLGWAAPRRMLVDCVSALAHAHVAGTGVQHQPDTIRPRRFGPGSQNPMGRLRP